MCQHQLWGGEDSLKLVYMTELLSRNFCWGSKTILECSKIHKNWTRDHWNKVLCTEESKFENFGSNRKVYVWRSVRERVATSGITRTVRQRKKDIVCGRGLPIAKSGVCIRWRANWIRPAITAYRSISRSHLERGLRVKDLYSRKIRTQSIPKRYIKS